MSKWLPIIFLGSTSSLFALTYIVFEFDPDSASWYVFALVVLLIFALVLGYIGLAFYFLRTRLYRRYSQNWYFKTSFKMAFFVASFVAICAILAIFQLVSMLTVVLVILALSLFALWSFLGKKTKI